MVEQAIAVEVVHAGAGRPILRRVILREGATVMEAIEASGIVAMLPGGVVDRQRLGVFSRKATPDQLVRDGDRIEIYRPLLLDPMEARRRRAR